MHVMTSYHQTVCNQDSSLVSLLPLRKEFELFFLDSQSPRSFCTQVCLHSMFLLLQFCFTVAGTQVQSHGVCRMDFATPWTWKDSCLSSSTMRHLTPPGNPDTILESLFASPQNIKSMPCKDHPETQTGPFTGDIWLSQCLGLSHFCDCKNQKVMPLLQYALPWPYTHNALVKLPVLFEHICIFTSMLFTNTRDTLLER